MLHVSALYKVYLNASTLYKVYLKVSELYKVYLKVSALYKVYLNISALYKVYLRNGATYSCPCCRTQTQVADYYNNRIQRRNSRVFTFSSLRRERSSCPGAIVCKSRATHRALITCKHVLRATYCEGTAQLLNLTALKSHLFELHVIG